MTDMGLHRLLREEQVLADLTIDETVGDELKDLELARRRLLFELPKSSWRGERDHGSRPLRIPARSSRLESTAVVAVSVQDLLTLRGVHQMRIGARGIAL